MDWEHGEQASIFVTLRRQVQGDKVLNSVKWALEAGYRHIDTAIGYKNEHDIGKVIKESGISRKELFLTSKIPPTMQGYDSALQGFQKSIKDLQTDYLDLLLIHWYYETVLLIIKARCCKS